MIPARVQERRPVAERVGARIEDHRRRERAIRRADARVELGAAADQDHAPIAERGGGVKRARAAPEQRRRSVDSAVHAVVRVALRRDAAWQPTRDLHAAGDQQISARQHGDRVAEHLARIDLRGASLVDATEHRGRSEQIGHRRIQLEPRHRISVAVHAAGDQHRPRRQMRRAMPGARVVELGRRAQPIGRPVGDRHLRAEHVRQLERRRARERHQAVLAQPLDGDHARALGQRELRRPVGRGRDHARGRRRKIPQPAHAHLVHRPAIEAADGQRRHDLELAFSRAARGQEEHHHKRKSHGSASFLPRGEARSRAAC